LLSAADLTRSRGEDAEVGAKTPRMQQPTAVLRTMAAEEGWENAQV
jgi:hypothetical protein